MHQNVPDLSKLGKQPEDPTEAGLHDLQEFSPREENTAKTIMADIQRKYGGKEMSEANQERMGSEVVDRFAAELGLQVFVTWADVVVDDHSDSLYYIPQVDVVGRIERTRIDHDEIKHQVTSGEADGRAYHVREDGTKHEDKQRTDFH